MLSEIPHLWRKAVNRWARLNRRHHREVDGQPAPSRNDEYLFYQSLVGVWPLAPPDGEAPRRVDRTACRPTWKRPPARRRSTRVGSIPIPEYDAAVREFVAAVLDDRPKNRFLAEFRRFHEQVVNWGLYSALSQTLLKLTSPGVPDIYQGQELWDFSLVDPDNRRPVDFARRREMLAQLRERRRPQTIGRCSRWPASLPRTLATPDSSCSSPGGLSSSAANMPTFSSWESTSPWKSKVRGQSTCAHLRGNTHRLWDSPRQIAIVIAPRLIAQLTPLPENALVPPPPLGPAIWEDTRIMLGDLASPSLKNLFTGQVCPVQDSHILMAAAFSDFPVALLTMEP